LISGNKFITLFQRSTNTKNFIPEIDGLRFIAIITVVIFHFHFLLLKEIGPQVSMDVHELGITSLGWWLVRMDLGVKVFFGISGFILSIPFLKQFWFQGRKVILKEYFTRRLTRLEPPFIIAITGFLLVHWLVLGEELGILMPHFAATLLYVHTLVYNAYSIILPVTWSLETEVQFYIAIPFLAILILDFKDRRISLGLGVLLFLSSILFRGYLLREGIYGMIASLPGFLSYFLVGIFFAYLFLTKEKWLRRKTLGWDFIGVLAFVGMFWFYKPQADFTKQLFFNLSIFILFCSAFKGVWINAFLISPVIYLIGGMCYTIYLLHLPLFGLFVRFSGNFILGDSYFANLCLQFVFGFTLLMVISAIFFIVIEKPCMDKNWHLNLGRRLGLIPQEKL
jgi:peptidoglycan/LPS O-acetylase OafA/YrhL